MEKLKKFISNQAYHSYYSYEVFLNKDQSYFKAFDQSFLLSEEILDFIVSYIRRYGELLSLRNNKLLFESMLKNHIFVGKNTQRMQKILDSYNLHLISFFQIGYTQNNRMLKLIDNTLKLMQFSKIFSYFEFLTSEQKIKLSNILSNNEVAQNKLNDIIKNNLSISFDFDQLIAYLTKTEKKSLMNI